MPRINRSFEDAVGLELEVVVLGGLPAVVGLVDEVLNKAPDLR